MPSEGRSLAESRMGMLYQGTEVPPPYVTRYRIPVRPVGGQTREFRLADPGVEGCRWQFTEARGLKIGNTLPDTHVLVEGQSGRAGALLLEKTFGGPACPAGESELTYPPCIFETPPGEASNALVTDAG
jgi:hypothetical protein